MANEMHTNSYTGPRLLDSLGKMLGRGTYRQIANAAWKNTAIDKRLSRELMVRELEKEATQLCSKKKPSCLRNTNKQSMVSFTMEKVSNELKERTPLLSAVSINRRSKAAKTAVCLKKSVQAYDCCATSDYNFYLSFQLDGMLRSVMLCYVLLCYVMSCHVMSCHVMSCHVMSCHVMSCHVMSCHVMSCYVIFPFETCRVGRILIMDGELMYSYCSKV